LQIRDVEGDISIGASLKDFGAHYRMESIVHSSVDKLTKVMHEFPKLREGISRNGIVSSALK